PSFQTDEVAEEKVLNLSERLDASGRDRDDEESTGADVRDLCPVRRPGGNHVVERVKELPGARAVARGKVEVGRSGEMRRAGRSAGRKRRWRGGDRVSGRREDDLATLCGKARRLQVPPGVARLEEGPSVRAIDVRRPDAVRLTLREMDVNDAIGGRRDRGIRAVDDQPLALAGPQIEALERILVPDEGPRLDDRGAAMEIENVAGAVEARRRVEDVIALVLDERFEAGAIEVDGVQVRAEPGLLVRLLGEREHDRLARRMEHRGRRRALRGEVDDPADRVTRAVEREQAGRVGEDERRLEPHAEARRRRHRRRGADGEQYYGEGDGHGARDRAAQTITS